MCKHLRFIYFCLECDNRLGWEPGSALSKCSTARASGITCSQAHVQDKKSFRNALECPKCQEEALWRIAMGKKGRQGG